MHCKVVNANYERVLVVMEKFLSRQPEDACKCPRCLNDIAAVALNFLPPHYVAAESAQSGFGSPWVMIEAAVAEAAKRVHENPNHPTQG